MTSSSQDMPAATPEAPYRDDPDAPLPASEQASAPGDEEQGTATPAVASQDAASPEPPRRQFNFILFHRITLSLAVFFVVGICVFTVLSLILSREMGFHMPWGVEQGAVTALFTSFFALIWAATSLWRDRKRQPPLSMAAGTVLHAIVSFYAFGAAAQSADGLGYRAGDLCYGGGRSNHRVCEVVEEVFWYFLLLYVVALFVFALLECILFVACLTTTYRSYLWGQGSEHGFRLPGGQISIEFSIRFLRQDAPPPAPIRGVVPPPARPASPPPLISTE